DPCLHLPEEILGDIDGARLAGVLEGQEVGGVQGTAVVAVAGRLAAAVPHQGPAGRPQGAGGGQLRPRRGRPAADPPVAPGAARAGVGPSRASGKYPFYRERPEKPSVRRKSWPAAAAGGARVDLPLAYGWVKVRQPLHSSELVEKPPLVDVVCTR